jgi:hypothetical protein
MLAVTQFEIMPIRRPLSIHARCHAHEREEAVSGAISTEGVID